MKLQKGASLLEILIAFVLLSVILVIALLGIGNMTGNKTSIIERSELLEIAREGIEISYNKSLADWESFKNLSGEYHPELDTSAVPHPFYILVPGEETLSNGYKRKLIIEKAKRNDDGNLSDSGTEDPSTMKVTSVAAKDGREVKLNIYLIDLSDIQTL